MWTNISNYSSENFGAQSQTISEIRGLPAPFSYPLKRQIPYDAIDYTTETTYIIDMALICVPKWRMNMVPTFRPGNVERIEFAKRLINLMRDNGVNQADLARKSGLTRDAVSTYCRARSMPEPSNLKKLADALGVEPSHFLLEVTAPTPEPLPASPRRIVRANDNSFVSPFPPLVPEPPKPAAQVFNMRIGPNGEAFVEIRATLPVKVATELMEYCSKLQRGTGFDPLGF